MNRRPSTGLLLLCSLALAAASSVAIGASEANASTTFTAGDLVVYRVGSGSAALSSAGAAVYLDEYAPSGSLVTSVPLPSTASGSNKPIVASGSANSEGGLTLSADGTHLVATGYDAAVGTAGLSSSAAASVPRTVASVDASGTVDTTTALTDAADGNNPRSAASTDGSHFWFGGAAGGVRYATLGATTSTSLVSSTYKNVRQLSIVDGQLYTSADPTKAAVTIARVGTGTPTTATQPVTNLTFSTAPTQPYAYSLLTLGTGTTPDTMYVADNSAGAVVKYVLVSGTWTAQGSVAVPNVTGLTANDVSGTVSIYATSSGSGGTTGTIYGITDSTGLAGTLSGTANVLASAPTNEAFRGVAFAPGTTIGTGGGSGPTITVPTVTPAYAGLPAALDDPTNPTLAITVGDTGYTADQLTLTATSSNTTVAPQSGIALSGTGATRTLTVTPGAVGNSTITLTATAPDTGSTTTTIHYAVSADLGSSSDRYYSGAGNGSTAIDVGSGYMIVGDDESNVLRLYNESQSGPPVKTFDFTSVLPAGTTEVDIEASARSGDMLYWTGSMSNNSSGALAPARSTLFAARITGSGASTTLTYVGSYTGLQSDLVNWDEANGHGLGANYLGLNASVNGGVDSHETNALNVEGMEFAGSSSTTAYLAFRAPLEPTTNRHLALVVPVTDINALVTNGNPGTTHATFGAPIFMDLGGLGIREMRENADGQYLIIAGTADDTNSSFVLYTWDGNPADAPRRTGTSLPLVPSGADQGSWETIVSVPDPLSVGSSIRLIEDNGDTAWYGDGLTSKTGMAADLQKDLGRTFTYAAPPTTAALAVNPATVAPHGSVTLTASITAADASSNGQTGSVQFLAGTTVLGTVSVNDGTPGEYRLSIPDVELASSASAYDVTAVFTPTDSSYGSSTSPTEPLTVSTTACPGTPVSGGSCTDEQSLQVTINPGSITITTPYTPTSPYVLPDLTLDPSGTLLSSSARFPLATDPQILVTSTLAGDPDWTVSLTSSDFTDSSADVINGENLGMTAGSLAATPAFPGSVAFTDNAAAHGVAPTDTSGGGLLGGPHTFAQTSGGGDGAASLSGQLTLNAPPQTPAGLYEGTITFSVA